MKIAFIGHKRIPSREGGIEVVAEELSTRMAARGEQVVVYNRRGHNVAGAQYDNSANRDDTPYVYKGVKVIPVTTIDVRGLAALTSSFFATLKAIKARPDVIHYHAEGPCVPLRLAHWAGIRTVATIHGLDWQRAKWGRFASAYLKLGERIAAKYANEIIVLSRNVQRYFKDTYGRDVRFIPNGIERHQPVPAKEISERYDLGKDDYVLFLGRIVPEKGVHYLIEAFKRLDTDKKLVIAGGSSDSADYYEQIKAAVAEDPRIILTGFVEGRTLEELYSNAYLYVLPSDLEGMPMSLLEAMSYGNACLTSDIPECAEVVGDHAVTFHHSDVDDLRDRLGVLLADSTRINELKNEASDYITDKYEWDKVTGQTLDLYEGKTNAPFLQVCESGWRAYEYV
ncbi:glycosyltransferase family 4 protein [Bifidobacterium eulemuris]|uniref:Glycosyltransferase family 1 n=1 Tax=Bifidobacterium eulemuris TaxID=1765219 RepID=A0A261GAT3_9BIFI|nr:glycosyltransferase family 4 protein [Bifidobacterium eulemuris]OZG68542.1 glycosyltransferase family 1 [Bifidobacterium eulemuris]QOL32672.1 glycosyltransferase family 4 protein [Bifidobacterium eulemuris]